MNVVELNGEQVRRPIFWNKVDDKNWCHTKQWSETRRSVEWRRSYQSLAEVRTTSCLQLEICAHQRWQTRQILEIFKWNTCLEVGCWIGVVLSKSEHRGSKGETRVVPLLPKPTQLRVGSSRTASFRRSQTSNWCPIYRGILQGCKFDYFVIKEFVCKNRYLVFLKKYPPTLKNFPENLVGLIWQNVSLSDYFIFNSF